MKERYADPKLKIFALNSNRPLAQKIADEVGVELGKLSVDRFSDGEIQINIEESVRGDNVYVIQSTSAPVNDNLMDRCLASGKCQYDQRGLALLRLCSARPESAEPRTNHG